MQAPPREMTKKDTQMFVKQVFELVVVEVAVAVAAGFSQCQSISVQNGWGPLGAPR